ncbi:helix-turn-helix domain-containing protein [Microlunatus parietis]|uniref:AraC-like DNA-binding protein n=1 Tax=Microlunatus parietis TaxID=682979 RepID=A0A7Y9ICT9_9ACTN|nr:AraC family transcriptional regulator [Microlunatus parietis]NYE73939.1 AraC-like DNA-binding protein [Microlunatus parietis]
MGASDDRAEVSGLLREDILLEWYRYPAGPAVVLPAHSHAEYQFNVSLDLAGGVVHRGSFQAVPAGQLAVIMPGVAHRPRDPADRESDCRHLTLYVSPETINSASAELAGRRTGLPTFRDLIIEDAQLVHRFVRLHRALGGAVSALDRDVHLLALFTDLVQRHAGIRAAPTPRALPAVRRARDYLHDHPEANISLAELAEISQLSAFHLARQFTAAFGVPPHAYQIQLRIEHAKRLLLAGRSASAAGHEAGFFDLSHFSRHFRRYVGATPGGYARRVGRAARTYIPRR